VGAYDFKGRTAAWRVAAPADNREEIMRGLIPSIIGVLLVAGVVAAVPARAADDSHGSVVVVFKDGHRKAFGMDEIASIDFKSPAVNFKDGHRQAIAAADIARIEFETSPADVMTPGRAHFIGKWEVAEGSGHSSTFYITLNADGTAVKTLGAPHGTWTLVDGEARISWDDGWHDAIRKVGTKHEKFAYEPGKTFSDPPSNVSEARNTVPKPI
jgi:hypothetical protein